MSRYYVFLFITIIIYSCISTNSESELYAIENKNSKTIKLINGNWFNGSSFDKKTAWVENGLMKFNEVDKKVDTIIDLSDHFVIPPFAEAHNHNLESRYELDKRINSYLDNGVFYVKLLSTIKKRIAPLMHNYNKPNRLDVSMTYSPLTGTGGHPTAVRKRYLGYGYYKGLFKTLKDIEFHGYVNIDNQEDLNKKWDSVLSFSPEFIKIVLVHSEEYEKRKSDTTYFGLKGLNPKLVPEIVNKSHAENLRVSVHVNTSHDFHVSVEAGVDEIAHLPEIRNGKPIELDDVRMAKQKEIIIVTTVSIAKKLQRRDNYREILENIKSNLKLLKSEGVTLAIGSDQYNGNSVGEFKMLHDLNVFTNLELLKMWTENSTYTTFPNRKVGHLKEGYEASFLVLDKNPIEDISKINESILLRVKQGYIFK